MKEINIKDRLLKNWNITRIAFLIIGISVIIQSVDGNQWLGLVFGGYIFLMGLFAFGCASGNCFNGSCEVNPAQKVNLPKN